MFLAAMTCHLGPCVFCLGLLFILVMLNNLNEIERNKKALEVVEGTDYVEGCSTCKSKHTQHFCSAAVSFILDHLSSAPCGTGSAEHQLIRVQTSTYMAAAKMMSLRLSKTINDITVAMSVLYMQSTVYL